jgi:uncharacterized protein (UPF0210 family)
MIRDENLDIRTVTMGISLFDCISDDPARLEQRIYDKITRCAGRLVSVCEELERTYGIPIVNKRISVTPISYVGAGLSSDGFVRLAKVLEKAAGELGVNPNTVAKAYAVLEEQGYICSLPKKGAFVTYGNIEKEKEDERKKFVYTLRDAGVDRATLEEWIKEVYGND